YEMKAGHEEPRALESIERFIVLQACDTHWQEYLRGMDALRQGVGLRAYGQRDPLVEYKKEAYEMFSDLIEKIKGDVVHKMFRASTSSAAMESFIRSLPAMYIHQNAQNAGAMSQAGAARAGHAAPPGAEAAMKAALNQAATPVHRDEPKVGRNDPCPCGSGKKYKKCCGAIL
ncbi:MAG: SEC-C metal-binding domain-containing protein, partial [Kiritimatiellae bacterium]|nr:SEC-C metal-binding domain-containing protein [Kiritimatiellia bacterium]